MCCLNKHVQQGLFFVGEGQNFSNNPSRPKIGEHWPSQQKFVGDYVTIRNKIISVCLSVCLSLSIYISIYIYKGQFYVYVTVFPVTVCNISHIAIFTLIFFSNATVCLRFSWSSGINLFFEFIVSIFSSPLLYWLCVVYIIRLLSI